MCTDAYDKIKHIIVGGLQTSTALKRVTLVLLCICAQDSIISSECINQWCCHSLVFQPGAHTPFSRKHPQHVRELFQNLPWAVVKLAFVSLSR